MLVFRPPLPLYGFHWAQPGLLRLQWLSPDLTGQNLGVLEILAPAVAARSEQGPAAIGHFPSSLRGRSAGSWAGR